MGVRVAEGRHRRWSSLCSQAGELPPVQLQMAWRGVAMHRLRAALIRIGLMLTFRGRRRRMASRGQATPLVTSSASGPSRDVVTSPRREGHSISGHQGPGRSAARRGVEEPNRGRNAELSDPVDLPVQQSERGGAGRGVAGWLACHGTWQHCMPAPMAAMAPCSRELWT